MKVMKWKKRGLLSVICMAVMLTIGGCGDKTPASQEETNMEIKESTMESIVESTSQQEEIQATTETTEVVAKEPIALDCGFDEDFEIKVGETLHVGREGISIQLTYITPIEEGVFFGYTLTIDGQDYMGGGFYGYYVEASVNQDVFTENRVKCINASEDGIMTLQITETTAIKEPLVLSGNAEDVYVTTQPEYVEKDNMILFLDEGVKVYGNTMELIETIFELAEEETGFVLDNGSMFSEMRNSGPGWLFGDDVFAGVDPAVEKFHIYVVPYEKCSACAPTYSMVVNPQDLEIEAGEGMAILHEYIHNLHSTNGPGMDRTMDEGYATYMTGRIADKDEVLTFNFDSRMNYSGYNKKITRDNAEAEFMVIENPDWEEYQYGYRFMTFLFEEYGEDVFKNILASAAKDNDGSYIPTADMPPFIKENTSETVFEEFADWLAVNKDSFEPY